MSDLTARIRDAIGAGRRAPAAAAAAACPADEVARALGGSVVELGSRIVERATLHPDADHQPPVLASLHE